MNTSGITRFFETDKKLALDDFMLLLDKDTDCMLLHKYLKDTSQAWSKRAALLKYAAIRQPEAFEQMVTTIDSFYELSSLVSELSGYNKTFITEKVMSKLTEKLGAMRTATQQQDNSKATWICDSLTYGTSVAQLNELHPNTYVCYYGSTMFDFRPRCITLEELTKHSMFTIPVGKIYIDEKYKELETFNFRTWTVEIPFEDIQEFLPMYTNKVRKKIQRVRFIRLEVIAKVQNNQKVEFKFDHATLFCSPYTKYTTSSFINEYYRSTLVAAAQSKLIQKLTDVWPEEPEVILTTPEKIFKLFYGGDSNVVSGSTETSNG